MTDEFENRDPHNLDEMAKYLKALPDLFQFVRAHQIKELAGRYMEQAKEQAATKGQGEFPLLDYGLSCYMTAVNEICEAISGTQSDSKAEREGSEKTLDAFRQAWLQLRFQTHGAEREN